MQNDEIPCPFCKEQLPSPTDYCPHCGKDLHGMKIARSSQQLKAELYRIVPDGIYFGIAVDGEIKIHGLDLKRAEGIADILNSVAEKEEAG